MKVIVILLEVKYKFMGCDIHMWVEVKKQWPNKKMKTRWETVGKVFKNKYHKKDKCPVFSGRDGYCFDEILTEHPYDDRNYTLYGFLADVRNGVGFAGVDTGDAIKPISKPKGLPKDVSEYVKKQSDDWSSDGHSHSWLSLKQLKQADWKQEIIKRGVVTEEEYKNYIKNGRPHEWAGDCWGKNIIILTEEQYKKLKRENDKEYRIKIQWSETLNDYCKEFMGTIKELENLLKYSDVSDVRIVFFFDN